uniref:Uncharacterized protein n=1 Tax=Dunaliella tertiolecta TaxID=3047 RepID=A0A7S3QQB2_DUNTE
MQGEAGRAQTECSLDKSRRACSRGQQQQQQQQQQQVQGLEQQGRQGHGQQEQEEVARSIAASAPAQAVVPASRQPRRQCTLVRQSCYVDSDDSGTSSPSDNDEL